MEKHELMLGNWIQTNKGKRQVEMMSPLFVFVEHSSFRKGLFTSIYFKDVQPIPITKNNLLKFGFQEYLITNVFFISTHNCFSLIKENDKFLFTGMGVSLMPIKYIHHLQNLIYNLSGNKLELELKLK